MHPRVVKVLLAGRLSYGAGHRLQKILSDHHHQRLSKPANTLVVLEHKPVYTVGIREKAYTVEEERKLKNLGAEFWRTNRGGLITFHGPGQLVAYPVLDLKQFRTSVRWYVDQLERLVIRLCAEFDIKAETSPHTGVWVDDRKICAMGIHCSRYVTTHGLALNCNTDLKWFEHIVPCGIEGKGVTSISKELNVDVTAYDILPIFVNAFREQFECELIEFPPNEASRILQDAIKVTDD
ncbi:PREDICTED: putative lipoyltransferase 2, mitochondrial [Dinoponera quadriceps]|uniref:lipoyl(octanoyl) transferase n=1 Tax=Dinoponera quadriceps TaxID=609295 RepID=A0A6P3WQ80_DINQU|nr:PREDICTED: putative lipoyltransferase 2, mitochondrial [Dinoponera quadriceps]